MNATETKSSAIKATQSRVDTTLVKGMSVLAALCRAPGPMGITALSSELGIGRSNAHRLLNTLVELGYVEREASTRRYSPTLRMWEQGSIVADRSRLRRGARQVLQRLAREEVADAVLLSALSGTEILYVEKLETARGALSGNSRPGLRVPALFPATGKVLLAHQPDAASLVETICATVPQAAELKPEIVMMEFRDIRENGYAISLNGWTSRATSIAVPVPHADPPRISIGIAVAPDERPHPDMRQFLPRLQEAAAHLADIIGNDPVMI